MISRVKLYIQDATCARFKWETIKAAHKVLSTHCDPSMEYNIRGSIKSSPCEKSIFFFEETFKILVNLDRQNLTPIIACPADELGKLLDMNGHCDHKLIEDRFEKYDEKMKQVSALETAMGNLQRTVDTLMKTSKPPAQSSVPPFTRERLQSQVMNNTTPQNRERSTSVSSLKRFRANDEDNENLNIDFIEPRYNRQREKKQKLTQENKQYSDTVKSRNGSKPPTARRQANWGTASNTSSSRLVGAIPELFISNCRDKPEEGEVKAYLGKKDVTILGVKMMSPLDSVKRSFRITVASYADYEKLLSGGQYLPRGVAVKQFISSGSRVYRPQWSTSLVNNPVPQNVSMDLSDFPDQSHMQSLMAANKETLSTPQSQITDPDSAAAAPQFQGT